MVKCSFKKQQFYLFQVYSHPTSTETQMHMLHLWVVVPFMKTFVLLFQTLMRHQCPNFYVPKMAQGGYL